MPVDLSAAIEHHRQGQLDQAARLYEAALAQAREHPDALAPAGTGSAAAGRSLQGERRLVSRAIAVAPPDAAAYHATLAEASLRSGSSIRR